MVKRDLERVGVPYRTEDGITDFHAAGRHSPITQLLRSGVSLPKARELAHHSDVNMTMRDTPIGLKDQAKAIANLPSAVAEDNEETEPQNGPSAASNPPPSGGAPTPTAPQMRCRFCSARGHRRSTAVNEAVQKKSPNPCRDKGLGNASRRKSATGKVEAAGIEPGSDIELSRESLCDCDECTQCRAANALLDCGPNCRCETLRDNDFKKLVRHWEAISTPMRLAILAIAGDDSVAPG